MIHAIQTTMITIHSNMLMKTDRKSTIHAQLSKMYILVTNHHSHCFLFPYIYFYKKFLRKY